MLRAFWMSLTAPHRKKVSAPNPTGNSFCFEHLANLLSHVNVVKSIKFQAGVFVDCRCQFRIGGCTTAQLPGNGPGHDYIDSYCTSFLCPPLLNQLTMITTQGNPSRGTPKCMNLGDACFTKIGRAGEAVQRSINVPLRRGSGPYCAA